MKENNKPYYVYVSRGGFTKVKASSADEAMKIVNESYCEQDINWDDDWTCVDAQPVDEQ